MTGSSELVRPPRLASAYARAAASMVPGASRLRPVPGGGGDVPPGEVRLTGVRIEPARLAAYARTCGFRLRDEIPATYVHVLAFPLHMALMTDGRFPVRPVGLVHVSNRIVQHRPVRIDDVLDLRVRATPLEPHARGRAFTVVSSASAGGAVVWEEESVFLHREPIPGAAAPGARDARADAGLSADADAALPETARWRLPAELGRRYAAVSGDRNPMHVSAPAARLIGFPRAIAHGMWTKARALAALEPHVPPAFSAEVRFRRPALLPSTVAFAAVPDGDGLRLSVRSGRDGTPHLEGRVSPR
jgi:acyl dehydratase